MYRSCQRFPAEFGAYRPRRQACRSSLFKSATHRRLVASSARQRSWVLWAVSPCVRDSSHFLALSLQSSTTMSARKIQIGQLWKNLQSGDTFLVTRVYTEALSTIVVLRNPARRRKASCASRWSALPVVEHPRLRSRHGRRLPLAFWTAAASRRFYGHSPNADPNELLSVGSI